MATKKQIKDLCKELNLKPDDFQKMWDELLSMNHFTVKVLSKNIGNWDKQNVSIIRQIPAAKETLIKSREAAEKAKAEEEAKALQALKEKEYYENNFEHIMFNKITHNENLSEKEIQDIIDSYEISRIDGESSRWTKSITSICKLENSYFQIDWEQGLTEYQENMYMNQPFGVFKEEKIVTRTRIDWIDAKNKKVTASELLEDNI